MHDHTPAPGWSSCHDACTSAAMISLHASGLGEKWSGPAQICPGLPPSMPSPFLDESFHVRWSTLAPEAVEADIRSALQRAAQQLDRIINQDRGRLTFESVMLGPGGGAARAQ